MEKCSFCKKELGSRDVNVLTSMSVTGEKIYTYFCKRCVRNKGIMEKMIDRNDRELCRADERKNIVRFKVDPKKIFDISEKLDKVILEEDTIAGFMALILSKEVAKRILKINDFYEKEVEDQIKNIVDEVFIDIEELNKV